MSNRLYRLGHFAARRPWAVIATWLGVAAMVIAGASLFGAELEDSMEVPGLDSQAAVDLLSAAGSDSAGLTAQVVATPSGDGVTFTDSAAAREALAELQVGLAALPNVTDAPDPAISPDGQVALIRVQYPVLEELSVTDLDNLKTFGEGAGESSALQIEMGGDLFFSFEEAPTGIGEMIGLFAAVVILLAAFGSVIAMGLPIGMALVGLALGITSMGLVTYLIDIPSWAPQMATMIGLGVGIDYALFLLTRHREFLAEGLGVADSAGRAVATAGKAVIFAGGTVVIAILGLAVAGLPFMTAAGVATSVVVGIMVIGSVTLLPAFLGLAGYRINGFRKKAPSAALGSGWRRWGEHVSRKAWVYAIGVTLSLLALTAPVLSLRLGFPDEGTLPETRTERRAYDLVAEGFGPGINGPLLIAVDTSGAVSVVEPLM
ncbi:MAG TPA: MMPL family transporter, partial [Acidimicrobiia bacterium]|nr:MMPL family transporter [Acidimicrobiia bacterium]